MHESLQGQKREREKERKEGRRGRNSKKEAVCEAEWLFGFEEMAAQQSGHVFISASVMPRSFLASLSTRTVVWPPSLCTSPVISMEDFL